MKIVIFGWFGAGNVGDEAILQAMLSLFSSHKELELDIISFNPNKTIKITSNFTSVKKIIKVGSKFGFLRSDFKGIWKSLKSSQAVIIGGGGLFQDIYNFYFIPFFTLIAIIAAKLKKRVLLYALGVGPFKRRIAQWLCRKAANQAAYISVRDALSVERLNELKINKEVHLAPDPVFLLKPAKREKAHSILTAEGFKLESSPKIGICLQQLFNWGIASEKVLAEILDTWIRDKNAQILFIPFGRYPNSWINPHAEDIDLVVSAKILSLMKEKAHILKREYTPDEIMAIIREMDVIISMRFHGLIMSLAMGVPPIGLTFKKESKLSNLLTQINLRENLFFIDDLNKNELINAMDHIVENYATIQSELRHSATSFQNQAAEGMNSLLGQIFKGTKRE